MGNGVGFVDSSDSFCESDGGGNRDSGEDSALYQHPSGLQYFSDEHTLLQTDWVESNLHDG